jgi:hypothetical protein
MMRMVSIPTPSLQIDFSLRLERIRKVYLQEALSVTVKALDIAVLDKELSDHAAKEALALLAGKGLRGELLFAVPCLLRTNPKLLGYYRLLLGFSQKEFYGPNFGVSAFKGMEDVGRLPQGISADLSDLCRGMNAAAADLLNGIGIERISRDLLDDLTLLTLGPQLRGGANVRKGTQGIEVVFKAIHKIVEKRAIATGPGKIELKNAAKRTVLIEFAPDPDIVIRELMAQDHYRNIIAIEIKGGTDFSNIHNRLGEAEKSHQKARQSGFVECWTVVNVNRLDEAKARQESPSTNRFYRISDIISEKGKEYADFRSRIIALTGIPGR